MLRLEDVHTRYGESHVLRGLSLEVADGEVATLLGRNGAGKTTAIRSIMGIARVHRGRIFLDGTEITGLPPHRVARLGVGLVPEERAIFPSLTVAENLELPARRGTRSRWSAEKVFEHFPMLSRRLANRGSQLSGGEQQMLAIARVLRMDVRLLLLDEPTQGLAPLLVREIAGVLSGLRREGLTILLVEQNARFAAAVAERHHVLYQGRIVYSGTGEEFSQNREVQEKYLGVSTQ